VRTEFLECLQERARDNSLDMYTRSGEALQLCWAYIDGFGTKQDIDTALGWIIKSAELDSSRVTGLIARLFDIARQTQPPAQSQWLHEGGQAHTSVNIPDEAPSEVQDALMLSMGAAEMHSWDLGISLSDYNNQLFNAKNVETIFPATQVREGLVFLLSTKKNNIVHAGAAAGVDLSNFDIVLTKAPEYINMTDTNGNTPLHSALRCNNPRHAGCLLKHGADASLTNKCGESPLHWLVFVDPVEQRGLVELMAPTLTRENLTLAAGPNPELFGFYGYVRHGGTPLHWAVESNCPELVEALLNEGADPQAVYRHHTPIDLAVLRNNSEVLRNLLSNTSDVPIYPTVSSEDEWRLIYESYVHYGTMGMLPHDRWLFHGRNWSNCMRSTIHVLQEFRLDVATENNPILVAAYGTYDSTEVLRLLVDEGFDNQLESKPLFWRNVLGECIQHAHPSVLHFIFDQYLKYAPLTEMSGADDLLFKSMVSLNCDASIVARILETGVDINVRNLSGETPLLKAVMARNYEVASFLLSQGASVKTPLSDGPTFLFPFLTDRDIDLGPLKYLLEPLHPLNDQIPDFIISPNTQTSALHVACERGSLAIVEYLLTKLVDVEQINLKERSKGWTALHFAIFLGHSDIAEILCKRGADVNAIGGIPIGLQRTPLDLCLQRGYPQKEAMERSQMRSFQDVCLGRFHIARYIAVEHRPRRDKLRSNWQLPLSLKFAILGAQAGFPKVLEKVVQEFQYEFVDAAFRQSILDSLLFFACGSKSVLSVRILVDAGANVNYCSRKSNTPLHIAARYGNPSTLHLLVRRGAKVNVVNDDDDATPLLYALQSKMPSSIRVLKRARGLIATPRGVYIKYLFTNLGREVPHIRGADLPLMSIGLEGEPSYEFEALGDEWDGDEAEGCDRDHEAEEDSEGTGTDQTSDGFETASEGGASGEVHKVEGLEGGAEDGYGFEDEYGDGGKFETPENTDVVWLDGESDHPHQDVTVLNTKHSTEHCRLPEPAHNFQAASTYSTVPSTAAWRLFCCWSQTRRRKTKQ